MILKLKLSPNVEMGALHCNGLFKTITPFHPQVNHMQTKKDEVGQTTMNDQLK